MPQRLTNIRARRISFVERAAVRDPANPTEPRRFVLFKAEDGEPTPEKGSDMTDTINKEDLDPTVRAALEKAEKDAADNAVALEKAQAETAAEKKAREAAEDKMADMKKAAGESTEEPINKDELPPAVAAALQKSEDDRKALETRLEKAESDRAVELEKRENGEYIAKAETGELRGIPGKPADVGPALRRLAKADPDAYAELEKSVLIPAAAQLRTGEIFKEQGAGGEGPPPESAVAKMEEAVTDLRKSDSSLTRTAAMERARQQHPDLAKAVAAEMRGVALNDPSVWGRP